MGHIQASHPSGSNPDGQHQLVHHSIQEQGETPFDFNTYNHLVWGALDAFWLFSTNLSTGAL